VDKNIMHYKVCSTVCHNAESDWKSCPKFFVTPKVKAGHANNGIKNKERIVAFKPTVVIFVMMIFV
jgi:hypothetical protein